MPGNVYLSKCATNFGSSARLINILCSVSKKTKQNKKNGRTLMDADGTPSDALNQTLWNSQLD